MPAGPGMGGPPPGGPGGVGGAAQPGAMAGNQMQGFEKVMIGLKALNESLGSLPLGSEIHNAVMKAVGEVGKHLPQGGTGGDPMAQIQQLVQMARGAKADPMQAQALQGMMGGGAGGAPPPGAGGAPPMPPMGA